MAGLEEHFPDFYQSTDTSSLDGQKRYVRSTRVQLIALVGAALFGAFTWQVAGQGADWAGVLAVAAFVVASFVRASVWRTRPERDWYAGRAAAESAKTLAWRFAVAAEPFPLALSDDAATDVLLARFHDVQTSLRQVVVLPPAEPRGEVTAEMLRARHRPLKERKRLYLEERVAHQRDWYARKARTNLHLSRVWMSLMLGLEVVGIIGGVLKATGTVDVDLLGLLGAIVAAIAAWSEMRQNSNLSSSYSVAARELGEIANRASRTMTEMEWSFFAANAEEAVSREHTMWAASRDA